MRKTRRLLAVVVVVMAASWAGAEEIAGLPLHVQRLDPTAIRVWVGDHISSTATVAFATSRGIVVVDTLGNPKVDAELRGVIARELGRSDFAMLINTHEHGDHTLGNAAYADCTIVGHELVGPGMAAMAANRERALEWFDRRAAELEGEIAQHPAGSPEAVRATEQLTLARLNHEVDVAAAPLVPPNLTFSDRMTLDMGDTTFELSFIGGMHSASDIAILVPEHGLLLTGDTMADVWLTDTPGCLASFGARPGIRHDFPLMLANWERLLAKRDQIRLLLPGHWNGELSIAGAEARVDYVRTLWEGIGQAAAAGATLSEVQAEYRLEERFPDLAQSPGFTPFGHYGSVTEIWSVATGQRSAALELYALLDAGAGEAAIREVLAERATDRPRFFFVEGEINGHGYRFVQDGRLDEAIAMFRINVELFPEAWNVYDSLGEALLAKGEVAEATAMYERSVALNPESPSGLAALARIRGDVPKS